MSALKTKADARRPSALLEFRVQPGASRERLTRGTGGWKLAVTAPPVEGKANRACTELLAKLLGVPRSAVALAAGAASRRKRFRVEGLSSEEAARRLAESAS